jgi:hypothetical protein
MQMVASSHRSEWSSIPESVDHFSQAFHPQIMLVVQLMMTGAEHEINAAGLKNSYPRRWHHIQNRKPFRVSFVDLPYVRNGQRYSTLWPVFPKRQKKRC